MVFILGENIILDIENMPRKIIDISLVEENKSDYTFFKIDEDESEDNETLKTLKQTYVTSSYKNETILNLQKELSTNSEEISKEIKLDSYNKYNNALDLATRHYMTKAVEFVDEALRLNPKDPDILNLKGLLYLLKCDFKTSLESFYTSQCYGNNELSRKYVNLLSSKEYKIFLERYNHSIRFINEELTEEAIEIFDSLMLEEPELIEPYVVSILLYDKVGDEEKKNALLQDLSCIDRDNPIFDKFSDFYEDKNTAPKKEVAETKKADIKKNVEQEEVKVKPKRDKKNIVLYIIIVVLVVFLGIFYIENRRQVNDLNNLVGEISNLNGLVSQMLNDDKEDTSKGNKQTSTSSDNSSSSKGDSKEQEMLKRGAEDLFFTGNDYKLNGDYEKALEYFLYALKANDTAQFKADTIYNLALVYQKLGDSKNAIKYYERYIYTYTKKEDYYDDAFYLLSVLYYENGRLDEAKDTLNALKMEVPKSSYNKTVKVQEILNATE